MSVYMGVVQKEDVCRAAPPVSFIPLAELTPTGFRFLEKQEVNKLFPKHWPLYQKPSEINLRLSYKGDHIPSIYEKFMKGVVLVDFGGYQANDAWYSNDLHRYAIDENRVMIYIGQGKIKALPIFDGLRPAELESLARRRAELDEELQSLQKQIAALDVDAEKQKLQDQKTALQDQISKLSAQKKEAEAAFQAAAAEAAESQQCMEGLKAMQSSLDTEIKSLTVRRDGLKKSCEESKSESAKLRSALQSLTDKTANLERQRSELEKAVANLTEQQKMLEDYFRDVISKPWAKLETLQLDSRLAEWMQQALAQKKEEQPLPHFVVRDGNSRNLPVELCAQVQKFRPNYSTLDILNIAVCVSQGFLTVFYGDPGCGKTSICNIFACVLGLKAMDKEKAAPRYVPVSVERGWMSKRDFIGYFNPLTKTFDSSNRQVYDALRILDSEPAYKKQRQKDGAEVLLDAMPFFILLDEANLSSMEYYWADFMNLCEDSLTEGRLDQSDGKTTVKRQIRGTVNLGEEQLEVPDWLRFLATINTDHTTETLSPRLIDRAWLISLPSSETDEAIDIHQIEQEVQPYHISWRDMQEAFGGNGKSPWDNSSAQKAFQDIAGYIQKECGVAVSHRVRQAVRRYWTGACKAFKAAWPQNAPYANPETAALDYAIAQRVLPQLNGSGADFYGKLDGLYEKCRAYKLTKSANIVQQVQARGKDSEYFQFF